jgi:hypothetical protein
MQFFMFHLIPWTDVLYDPARSDAYRAIYPVIDPGTASLGWLAMTLCLLGYLDQALERSRQGLELARKLAQPFNLVFTLGRTNQFHLLRREGEASLSTGDECLHRAIEYGFAQMSTWAAAHRGRALIELGRFEEGVVQLKESVAALRANGWQLQLTAFLRRSATGITRSTGWRRDSRLWQKAWLFPKRTATGGSKPSSTD